MKIANSWHFFEDMIRRQYAGGPLLSAMDMVRYGGRSQTASERRFEFICRRSEAD
jgi:hypothetical protein